MIMLGAFLEAVAIETGAVKCFAKIKFGQIISEARGKIAGMVFSKNKSCAYIRTKATPIQPRTSFTQAVRANLTAAAKAWKGFSDTVRAEFTAHADELNIRNSLGDAVRISGFNFYISLCRSANQIGQGLFTTYPGRIEPGAVTSFSVACTYLPDKITLTYSPVIPASDYWILLATRPMSIGRQPKKGDFRQIDFIAAADVSPLDITTAYTDKFGQIPQAGQQGWLKVVPINSATCAKFKAGAELAKSVK